jgi:hypothetical protein
LQYLPGQNFLRGFEYGKEVPFNFVDLLYTNQQMRMKYLNTVNLVLVLSGIVFLWMQIPLKGYEGWADMEQVYYNQ